MAADLFAPLLKELDNWSRCRAVATLWWRDDDAAAPCAPLERLTRLGADHGVACGLAVVPARTGPALRDHVLAAPGLLVLQHGYAHVNHAPPGNGAWELGPHRPTAEILAELRAGMEILRDLFGTRFVPAVVPPWNRMDPALLALLPGLGFRGVSASHGRDATTSPLGMRRADAHCDLLSWKGGPARFAGQEKCVTSITEHLKEKRSGRVNPDEPTGVLTHHLEMDEDAWIFMDDLLSATRSQPAAAWTSPADIWPPAE
ncbi:MAG: polysaccharide deacetylase family protein [Pseudomonadota bacterium]